LGGSTTGDTGFLIPTGDVGVEVIIKAPGG